jgi:hypothetical protein
MTVAQMWTIIGVMATAVAAMVTFSMTMVTKVFGSMRGELTGEIRGLRNELTSEIGGLRSEMRSEISGLRSEIGGLRNEMHSEIAGLRSEMVVRTDAISARLDRELVPLRAKVDLIDRDVYALTVKVFGGEPPHRES